MSLTLLLKNAGAGNPQTYNRTVGIGSSLALATPRGFGLGVTVQPITVASLRRSIGYTLGVSFGIAALVSRGVSQLVTVTLSMGATLQEGLAVSRATVAEVGTTVWAAMDQVAAIVMGGLRCVMNLCGVRTASAWSVGARTPGDSQ